MIEQIGNYLSELWKTKTNATYEQYEELSFLIQYFLFHIIVIGLLFMIAWYCGLFKECVCVFLSFVLIKRYAFDLHADTYGQCGIITITYILFFALLAKLLIPFPIPLFIITLLCGSYLYKIHILNQFILPFLRWYFILIGINVLGLYYQLTTINVGIGMGIISVAFICSDMGRYLFIKANNLLSNIFK